MTGRMESLDPPWKPEPAPIEPATGGHCGDRPCSCASDRLLKYIAAFESDMRNECARLERQIEAWRLFGRSYRCNGAEAKDTREALRLAERCT